MPQNHKLAQYPSSKHADMHSGTLKKTRVASGGGLGSHLGASGLFVVQVHRTHVALRGTGGGGRRRAAAARGRERGQLRTSQAEATHPKEKDSIHKSSTVAGATLRDSKRSPARWQEKPEGCGKACRSVRSARVGHAFVRTYSMSESEGSLPPAMRDMRVDSSSLWMYLAHEHARARESIRASLKDEMGGQRRAKGSLSKIQTNRNTDRWTQRTK